MQYQNWEKRFYRANPAARVDIMQDALLSGLYSTEDMARMVRETFTMAEFLSRDITYWKLVIGRFGFHMEPGERQALGALPDRITIYRGYCGDSGTAEGISWTIDKTIAAFFAKDYARTGKRTAPAIAERVIGRDQITAFCQARDESEVILVGAAA